MSSRSWIYVDFDEDEERKVKSARPDTQEPPLQESAAASFYTKCNTNKDVQRLVDYDHNDLDVEAVVPDAAMVVELMKRMADDEKNDPLCAGGAGFTHNLSWIWNAWKLDLLFVLRIEDGEKELLHRDAESGKKLLVSPVSYQIIVPALLSADNFKHRGRLVSILWVQSDLRRLGIGTRLVEECVGNHEVRGAYEILEQSKKFWEQIDFDELGASD